MSKIQTIQALEILDSRGNPTIKVKVVTSSGHVGEVSIPSGASVGKYEALELRDQDKYRFHGKGVLHAIKYIEQFLFPALKDISIFDQEFIDHKMIEMDATPNKSTYGANTILGISLAVAKAAAAEKHLAFYEYLGSNESWILPVPLINILNGGAHADNNLSFQEFMIRPMEAPSFKEGLRWAAEIFHCLKSVLKEKKYSTAVGDEGGFSPSLSSETEALELILEAIDRAGYEAGKQITLALDCAASEYYELKTKTYLGLSCLDYVKYLERLCYTYPITSIEDPLDQNDWETWKILTQKLPIQIVGDDLFVTHPTRLKTGIENRIATAILIKPNQIGTLTETLETIRIAKKANYGTILSHRSGETEDTTLADLCVGTNCGQIKAGSLSRSERLAKYNRLLEIEKSLQTFQKQTF